MIFGIILIELNAVSQIVFKTRLNSEHLFNMFQFNCLVSLINRTNIHFNISKHKS